MLSEEVAKEIVERLGGGQSVSPTVIAGALGLSHRQMRKGLCNEGTTFSALLDAERLAQSVIMLAHTDLNNTEIAKRLQFKKHTSFVRFFVRMTGERPELYRRYNAEGAISETATQ